MSSMAPQIELRGAGSALFDCTAPRVLLDGPGRSGKTLAICAFADALARKHKNSRILFVRQTRSSLTESVLDTFEGHVLGERLAGFGAASRGHRTSYDYVNGSTVVLGSLDTPERLYSTEWDLVCLFEAIEADRDAYERFGRGMSGNHMPLEDSTGKAILRNGKIVWRTQIIMDTNPGAPGHWLNVGSTVVPSNLGAVPTLAEYKNLQRWNARAPEMSLTDSPDPAKPMVIHRLLSRHPDNPRFWDRTQWKFTPDGEAVVLRELASMTGHRRARLFEGRWIAAEGVVFPEFDDSVHVVDDFEPPLDWPQILAWDPGQDHPTAILWLAVSPAGRIFVIDEMYGGGGDLRGRCEEIHRRNNPNADNPIGRNVRRYFGDPQDFFSDKSNGRSCAYLAMQCGFRFDPWPRTGKNAQGMVNNVRDLLIRRQLFVCRRCLNTIMEFQSWRYKRMADGSLPAGDDAFEKINDHAMDCLKGVVSGGVLRYNMGQGTLSGENG